MTPDKFNWIGFTILCLIPLVGFIWCCWKKPRCWEMKAYGLGVLFIFLAGLWWIWTVLLLFFGSGVEVVK